MKIALTALLLCLSMSSWGQTASPAGDVDANGQVSVQDALLALRYVTGEAELRTEQLRISDLNGDGGVTISDVVSILRLSVGLPVPSSNTILVPPEVTIDAVKARNPVRVRASEGGMVDAKVTGTPAQTGGITFGSSYLQPGVLPQDTRLALEVLLPENQTLERIRRVSPQAVEGKTSVAEVAFGGVEESTGMISTNVPLALKDRNLISLGVSYAQGQTLSGQMSNSYRLKVRRLTGTAGNQRLTLHDDCKAGIGGKAFVSNIDMLGQCTGHLVISLERE